MNKKQLFCLWCGIAVFVFAGLASVANSYAFRWKDLASLLIVFWPSIAIVTGGLIYTFRDKKKP